MASAAAPHAQLVGLGLLPAKVVDLAEQPNKTGAGASACRDASRGLLGGEGGPRTIPLPVGAVPAQVRLTSSWHTALLSLRGGGGVRGGGGNGQAAPAASAARPASAAGGSGWLAGWSSPGAKGTRAGASGGAPVPGAACWHPTDLAPRGGGQGPRQDAGGAVSAALLGDTVCVARGVEVRLWRLGESATAATAVAVPTPVASVFGASAASALALGLDGSLWDISAGAGQAGSTAGAADDDVGAPQKRRAVASPQGEPTPAQPPAAHDNGRRPPNGGDGGGDAGGGGDRAPCGRAVRVALPFAGLRVARVACGGAHCLLLLDPGGLVASMGSNSTSPLRHELFL